MGVTPGPGQSWSKNEQRAAEHMSSVRPSRSHSNDSGFLQSLFDFSFEESITPMIVRGSFALYLILDIIISILILASQNLPFLLKLILAFMFFFGSLIFVRLTLEATMSLHNIEKYSRESARRER